MSARRLALAAAVIGLAAITTVPSYADHDHGNGKSRDHLHGHSDQEQTDPCVGNPQQVETLSYSVKGQTATALYALPAGKPRGIVVFDHGYGHTMYSWSQHIARTAASLGVIAIAPDYRGQVDSPPTKPGGLPSSRGWQVQEGAEDSIAAVQLFDRLCGHGGINVVYGVSMGGNTSGLVVASKPQDAKGKPLFDYWVAVEPAVNVTETYQGARALAGVNTFAANAREDIEKEMGGSFESKASVYAERTVVNRTDDIVASGIKGVVIAHGVVDGLVTHDESRQLQALLRLKGMPVDMLSFLTHSKSSEAGTTVDGYAPVPHDSPFAGHASETSTTQDVGVAGFAALARLYSPSTFTCGESLYDGATGQRIYADVKGC